MVWQMECIHFPARNCLVFCVSKLVTAVFVVCVRCNMFSVVRGFGVGVCWSLLMCVDVFLCVLARVNCCVTVC